jgi:hypothetical protein
MIDGIHIREIPASLTVEPEIRFGPVNLLHQPAQEGKTIELETQQPCEECQRKQDLIDTFEMEANAASANQDEDEKAWHEFMGGPHYATPTLREAWDAAIAHARNRKL